jgi:hypothetical protein
MDGESNLEIDKFNATYFKNSLKKDEVECDLADDQDVQIV